MILNKFPNLAPNIVNLKAPITVSAEIAAKIVSKANGISSDEVGIYFITPCAAKATEIYNDLDNGGIIKGAISVRDLYKEMRQRQMPSEEDSIHTRASAVGLKWAVSGGEASFLDKRHTLHVSGVKNILKCLEDIDMGKLKSVKFLELLACTEGCVGGCLTVESPFVAKREIQLKSDELTEAKRESSVSEEEVLKMYNNGELNRPYEFKSDPVLPIAENRAKAIKLMNITNEVFESLPGFDCGSCGAPNCYAMAEDVAMGEATKLDCIFLLKDTLSNFSQQLLEMTQKVIPLMSNDENEQKTKETK